MRVFEINIFKGRGSLSHAQFPTWRIGVFLYVWVVTFDLSVMEDLASGYVPTAELEVTMMKKLFARKRLDATGD